MSIQFNDTSTYKGLVQMYEKEIGANKGDVSDDTDRLKEFAADVNVAMDDFIRIAIQAGGTWQFDDSNHTDYPIIRTNIVSGQRDYAFTTDGSGNFILDFYRVRIADANGNFSDVTPRDLQSQSYFSYEDTETGVATEYDKTANSLILNLLPNYNYTNGIEVYINREGSYLTYGDTTKKPGVPGILHKYFYLKPASEYARRNGHKNANSLANEVMKMEGNEDLGIVGAIGAYFSARPKDEKPRMSIIGEDNR